MFIVIELQVSEDGSIGNLVFNYNTFPEAQNKFYTICAFASISQIPIHSVIILDRTGVLIDRQSFIHSAEIILEEEQEN